ncbi:MAG: DUF1329 domain-containing protein [Candidatus Binataceae bacterium]
MLKEVHAWTWRAAALLFAVGFFIAAPPASAQVKPGDTITYANSYKVKNLVSPGVYYKVVSGMTMKVVPTERIDWPPPYRDATEKYADQVRLSPDGRTVVNYVAGQPFPFLDPNDPGIATKIMWNNAFRPITTDDYDLRYYDCDVVNAGRGHPVKVIDYYQIGHYAGYDEVGRTEVQPLPIDPDFKVTNRYWMFALYPILAPENDRGGGFIRYRYENPRKGDDIWNWSPGTRRVRRLNEALMGDAVNGGGNPTNFDPDHYSGFNAKIEEYNYKFLGQKTMLASVNAVHSPEITCQTDGGASACPENWEMRQLYVVQTQPRLRANNSQAIHGKSILYIDSEVWFEPYVDEYDAQGQLWQNHIYWLTYRDRPVPDARVAIYPFKRAFVVGAASTDVQSGQATMCYLPGQHTPERECWYINMGAVSRDFFTTQAMVKAAP